jgi:hypothetical protein
VIIIETPRSEKIEVTLSAISIAWIWLLVRDMTMLPSILSHGLQSWEGPQADVLWWPGGVPEQSRNHADVDNLPVYSQQSVARAVN